MTSSSIAPWPSNSARSGHSRPGRDRIEQPAARRGERHIEPLLEHPIDARQGPLLEAADQIERAEPLFEPRPSDGRGRWQ